jgi:hypothetical protein
VIYTEFKIEVPESHSVVAAILGANPSTFFISAFVDPGNEVCSHYSMLYIDYFVQL